MSSLMSGVQRAYRWHRPLMLLAAVSIVLLGVCLVGMIADPRVLTGAPIWEKPAKFAISTTVYSFTMAWLISLLTRGRRFGSVLGTIIAVMLAGELVVIVGQVVRGRTSHFDFVTDLDADLYQAMGVMIGVLWLANIALAVLVLVQRMPDRALAWALRLGMLIAVVGMGLAFLMTLPTPGQVGSWNRGGEVSVVGAHTVGLPDGGAGLPLLGWSTVGGDLRIPHFVGLHGLQVMILVALLLTALGRRFPRFAAEPVRLRIVAITAATYLAVLSILAWQALRAQSIVHPDALTVSVTAVVALGSLAAYALTLRVRGPRHPADSAQPALV